MVSILVRRCVFAFALGLVFSSSTPSAAFEDDEGGPYRGLGQESCRQYLQDVASDQAAQQLYSAWLSGFVTIAYAELQVPQFLDDDVQLHAANDWIKRYCANRASDTYLAATVSLLSTRERNLP